MKWPISTATTTEISYFHFTGRLAKAICSLCARYILTIRVQKTISEFTIGWVWIGNIGWSNENSIGYSQINSQFNLILIPTNLRSTVYLIENSYCLTWYICIILVISDINRGELNNSIQLKVSLKICNLKYSRSWI